MNIYYAHPISLYDSEQEQKDINTIERLFPYCTIFNPNNTTSETMYKQQGMQYFKDVVSKCDLLIFRALPFGYITAGVWTEINCAKSNRVPVLELPSLFGREMNVNDTKLFLEEIGYRKANYYDT